MNDLQPSGLLPTRVPATRSPAMRRRSPAAARPQHPLFLPALLVALAALVAAGCSAADADGAAAAAGSSSAATTPGSAPGRGAPASSASDAAAVSADADVVPPTPVAGGQQKQFPPPEQLQKVIDAYTVANEHPDLLTGLPCYCPCELYGHGGVVDCHRSQHAAMCNVCMGEAIEAGELYDAQMSRGEADIAAVQAQVKDRYRRALVAQTAQQLPMMNTRQGQAFLQACSDCHQPPSPAMHTVGDWDTTLTRMSRYAQGRDPMPDPALWEAAVGYVKQVATQVPAASVAQMHQSLRSTVDHIKETEGDSAYYPSVRDDVLDPAWARRMASAYDSARALPTELLAATPTACKPCSDAGNTDLLACLNSWQAITCETAIEEVEKLVAKQGR